MENSQFHMYFNQNVLKNSIEILTNQLICKNLPEMLLNTS